MSGFADQYRMSINDVNGKEIFALTFRALGWDHAMQEMRTHAILHGTHNGPMLEVTLRRLYKVTQEGN